MNERIQKWNLKGVVSSIGHTESHSSKGVKPGLGEWRAFSTVLCILNSWKTLVNRFSELLEIFREKSKLGKHISDSCISRRSLEFQEFMSK